jgi:glycosyltransferase involved in cell wall biosynthesis
MRSRPRVGIVTSQASRLNGGVFEAVVTHTEMVRSAGFEPIVFALADEHSAKDRPRFGDTEVVTSPVVGPGMVGFAPAMLPAMLRADLDLVHLHGIWMYPSRAVARWAEMTGRPAIISPHGMLDPWILSRGRLKKAVARQLYERGSWRRAACFHALTEAEAADIRGVTGRSETIVIANAVAATSGGEAARPPVIAYLGRIHPKKNLDGLIRGWRQAADILRPIGATLRIAGWGEDEHVAALKAQVAEQPEDGIAFVGSVFGNEKATLLTGARFSTLPSHSEGLPMVILEAWAAGTPTLMSEHCHLPEGIAAGCALDCGTDDTTIAETLRRAFALPHAAWHGMSVAARALARDRFSPHAVARRWHDTYDALLAGRPPA